MKKELEKIIKHIVDFKELATIEDIETTSTITLIMKVAGEDYGRIVGAKGRTIEMLKDLIDAYSDIPLVEKNHRLILEDPQTTSWGRRESFKANPEWKPSLVQEDLSNFIKLFGEVELSVIDTGTQIIFECIEGGNNYMDKRVKETITFLTMAMCKGYGRNAVLDFC